MAQSLAHRKIIGTNIRIYRKQAKFTLEKLAEKADLNWTYVSDVERGRHNVSADTLARIAKALGVTIADLVAGT